MFLHIGNNAALTQCLRRGTIVWGTSVVSIAFLSTSFSLANHRTRNIHTMNTVYHLPHLCRRRDVPPESILVLGGDAAWS